jgi:hypothetical protein
MWSLQKLTFLSPSPAKSQSARAFLEDVCPQFSMIPVPVDVPVQSDSEAGVPLADCLVVAAEAGIANYEGHCPRVGSPMTTHQQQQ